jgi:hypothetical protein
MTTDAIRQAVRAEASRLGASRGVWPNAMAFDWHGWRYGPAYDGSGWVAHHPRSGRVGKAGSPEEAKACAR